MLLFFQILFSLVPKNEICLKYILDKNSHKQPLWVYCILTAAVHCTIQSQLSSSSILQQNLLSQNWAIKGPSVGWKKDYCTIAFVTRGFFIHHPPFWSPFFCFQLYPTFLQYINFLTQNWAIKPSVGGQNDYNGIFRDHDICSSYFSWE